MSPQGQGKVSVLLIESLTTKCFN